MTPPVDAWVAPTRVVGNPVINFGGGGWKDFQVQEPSVFIDPTDATKLIMFYAGETGFRVGSIGRATATAANPTVWTDDPGNPIFTAGGANIRLDAVQFVAGLWYLYYSDTSAGTVNLATSADGLAFVPYSANPVLSAAGQGCSDGSAVQQGSVLFDSGTWHMFYNWHNGGTVNQGVRYATSSDGKTWSKVAGSACANVVSVGASYDAVFIEWHSVLKVGADYILSYEGYNGSTWTENIAYSNNPASGWQKSLANPLFSGSGAAGSFDQVHVATPSYAQIGGNWYLFYQGAPGPSGGLYVNEHWAMGQALLPVGLDPTAAIP